MPGARCAVALCNNSYYKMRKENRFLTFHNFPKNPERKKEWVKRCRRQGDWNPDTCMMCSEHFDDDAYERDLQGELLGLPTKRRLKASAIPTLNLGEKRLKVPPPRDLRYKKKERKRIVNELMSAPSIEFELKQDITESVEQSFKVEDKDLTANVNEEAPEIPTLSLEEKLLQITPGTVRDKKGKKREGEGVVEELMSVSVMQPHMEQDIQVVEEQSFSQGKSQGTSTCKLPNYQKLYESLSDSLKDIKDRYRKLQKQLLYYKKKCTKTENVSNRYFKILSQIFTPAQISVLLEKKKRVNWSKEDVARALVLRYFSMKSYLYVRENLKFPLPGASSLRRWAKKLDVTSLLNQTINQMKSEENHIEPSNELVVLQLDEVNMEMTVE